MLDVSLSPSNEAVGMKCFHLCVSVILSKEGPCTGPWPPPPQPPCPPRTGPCHPIQDPSPSVLLAMLKCFQFRPHFKRPRPLPNVFKLVHYEVQTVDKRAVGIRLKCLLVVGT